jgi:uncharacterized protein (TIGR01244 family)
MNQNVQPLSADVCATGQLGVADIAWAAQAGFKSIINNRPDFEGGADQPTSSALEATALAAGLRYAHLPVAPTVHTPENVAQFGKVLAELPKPVLLFCRSGGRSTRLYMASIQE